MKNRIELRAYIRFQLSQLGARNGAHVFELLCFELARARHVRNLLPATGPVQAGGDQGRDFESYRTTLRDVGLASSSFVALVAAEMIVGACTLERGDTAGKIRRDLKSIFSGGECPDRVLYFCEQDISVASRHKIQAHCRGAYGAALDIFDGQAIADQLADPDTFWIATQFLDIPAEFYPQDQTDEAYVERRTRWVIEGEVPESLADFLEIKEGLRAATREEALLPDLSGWLKVMHAFLAECPWPRFRQKARYEIAVAELRGRGNLDPALPLVEAYFRHLEPANPLPVDILDAAVLTVFCSGAVLNGHTRIEPVKVQAWSQQVGNLADLALASAERRGERCTLLEAQAALSGVPAQGAAREETLDAMLAAWSRVVELAQETPFYPVWHIADFVERTAPALGQRPAYRALRDRIDELTRVRSGGHAVAERSERRGLAHLEAGRLLPAIDELQRAKVGWYSGEAMENSLRAMVMLSQCYADLGLALAARYYAAGATYLGLHSDDDDVRALAPGAAFQLVRTLSAAGEVVSALSMMRHAIVVHFAFSPRPNEVAAHPMFAAVLAESAVGFTIVRRLAPHLTPLTDAIVDGWPITRQDSDLFLKLASGPQSPWTALDEANLLDRIEEELGRSPFGDIGPVRTHVWSALGVDWTLACDNTRETTAAALGLAAILQIIQAELAHEDLLVIPGPVLLEVALGPVSTPDVRLMPASGATWRVILPAEPLSHDRNGMTEFHEVFAIALTVLGQVTAMDADSFGQIIEAAMTRDLTLRAYSVRPARELMDFATTQVDVSDALALHTPVELARPIKSRLAAELAWPTGTAPGYSEEKAREMLANRYRRPWETARPSLERAFADPRVRTLVLEMRTDGLLDWQILGIFWNILCQAQVEAGGRLPVQELGQAFLARAQRMERPADPVVNLAIIDRERLEGQRHIANINALTPWGLRPNRPDLDVEGLRRFLDVRFRQAVDDIPHEDLFGGPRVEPRPLGEAVPDGQSLER